MKLARQKKSSVISAKIELRRLILKMLISSDVLWILREKSIHQSDMELVLNTKEFSQTLSKKPGSWHLCLS